MSGSPRSSALSRASSMKAQGQCSYDLVSRLEKNIHAVLLLLAAVASIVIAWVVGGSFESVATQKGWPKPLRYGTVSGCALLAVFGVTAWVTGEAYLHADQTTRMVLLALFVGIAGFLGLALWLFFVKSEAVCAFYLVVAVVLGVLIHSYLVQREAGTMALLGMAPAIVVGAFLLWKLWPESADPAPQP